MRKGLSTTSTNVSSDSKGTLTACCSLQVAPFSEPVEVEETQWRRLSGGDSSGAVNEEETERGKRPTFSSILH